MKDKDKTKKQVINELAELRQWNAELEKSETQYKLVEKKLRKEKDYLEKLHNSIGEAIFTVKMPERAIEFANSFIEDMFGYKAEECFGKKTEMFYPDKEGFLEFGKKLKKTIEQGKDIMDTEQLLRRKNGEIFPSEIKTSFFRVNGEITQVISIIRDVTERKKAEQSLQETYQKLKETQEQLIQAEKMSAIGQLAAGISHELNQPLTGIKGFSQAILMDLDKDNPINEDLRKIIEQANRMDKIIQRIRLFARKSDFKIQEFDINQPIEDSFLLLNKQLSVHNVQVEKSLSKNLPRVQGDPNQLEQVFLNLITNARDAINSLNSSKGEKITIKTSLSKDKKHIEITFKDTGCGICKGDLTNIFNPFFTTKFPDGGTGLGLSLVYRIIENHKGKISVKSKEGKGTTVRILLPIT